MAVTRVGQNAYSATSGALPTHQAGDLIVCVAFGNASTTPSLPAGWTSEATFNQASYDIRVGWKIAASSGETSGTWANATKLMFTVYRGYNSGNPLGAVSAGDLPPLGSVSIPWPSLPMEVTDGTSFVSLFVTSANTAITYTPPAGATEVYDTNGFSLADVGPTAAWVGGTGTRSNNATTGFVTIEIRAAVVYTFALASADYQINPSNLSINKRYKFILAGGDYQLVGSALGILAARRLTLAAGDYQIAGSNLALLRRYTAVLESAEYRFDPSDITWAYVPAGNYLLVLGTADYDWEASELQILRRYQPQLQSANYCIKPSELRFERHLVYSLPSLEYEVVSSNITLSIKNRWGDETTDDTEWEDADPIADVWQNTSPSPWSN